MAEAELAEDTDAAPALLLDDDLPVEEEWVLVVLADDAEVVLAGDETGVVARSVHQWVTSYESNVRLGQYLVRQLD